MINAIPAWTQEFRYVAPSSMQQQLLMSLMSEWETALIRKLFSAV